MPRLVLEQNFDVQQFSAYFSGAKIPSIPNILKLLQERTSVSTSLWNLKTFLPKISSDGDHGR